MSTPRLTASYVTLAGAGFAEPPRFTFRQRCEAASAAGFARIGVHLNDLKTLETADVADILSDNDLELGEIEFFAGWAAPGAESATRATLEKARELAVSTGGGDHLSSGDFAGGPLDIDGAAARLKGAAEAVADVGLTIAVEAFGWSAITSVPTASALLARADAHNAGHLLDVWHFYNTGSTAEAITNLDVTTVAQDDAAGCRRRRPGPLLRGRAHPQPPRRHRPPVRPAACQHHPGQPGPGRRGGHAVRLG